MLFLYCFIILLFVQFVLVVLFYPRLEQFLEHLVGGGVRGEQRKTGTSVESSLVLTEIQHVQHGAATLNTHPRISVVGRNTPGDTQTFS